MDPWQAVAREATFAGSFALADLPRLRDLLVGEALAAAACVAFEVAFRRDEARRPVVLGRVKAVLPLECQRCLGVVEHGVDVPVRLMLMQGAEVTRDPPEPYEPLPVSGERIGLAELIEDELLLALPQIPLHPPGTCRTAVCRAGGQTPEVAGPGQREAPTETAPGQVTPDRPNPFAVLVGWKPGPDNRT